ncbi:MAG: hypothetical protein JST00_15450 [Deltaproteobacteria bacterium]|nr:hypothetical protein [Deltaproteobacteria bacterium]
MILRRQPSDCRALAALSLLALVSLVALALGGCPPADKREPAPSKPEACTKFGQTCEFSPGKLGTCVTKDGCTEAQPSCFVCQSQH